MNTQNASHNRTTSTALCFELSADVPEWVEVLPPGPSVVGRDGRTWSYDPAEVMANTQAHSKGADLPFDYLHATELKAPLGDDAPASGWAREYRVNERGALEARVDWTAKARNSISEREYRYLSPVFTYDDTGRIHRFSSFGLTNKPNLLIKALNAEQVPSMENPPMLAEAIRAALGLPENATEEQAVAAINALKEAEKTALNSEKPPSLRLFVPRDDYNALEQRAQNAEQALAKRDEKELETAINSEITAALKAGKITPATKDYHVAACQEKGGLERFREFVKAAPSVTGQVISDELPKTTTALNSEQQQAARMLGMSDDQYIKHTEGGN
ncbi:phage protease [Pseudomonas sp. NPDC079086]|uniref:phage protease n=1 Tax=unclassified Pseudomonas TaxID=196821 RepID=UPI0037C5C510